MKQRDTFLDFAKGIAIFLVVLGHVLEKSMEQRNGVYHFIYQFHMPFFFMLSGYLACRTTAFDGRFYLKKIRSLLLPFFFVGMSFTVLNGQYRIFFFDYFHNGYWFLLSLFCVWCLFSWAKGLVKKLKIENPLMEAFLLFMPFMLFRGGQFYIPEVVRSVLSIDFTSAFYRFFVVGYFMGKYNSLLSVYLYRKGVYVSAVVLFVLVFLISLDVELKSFEPFTVLQLFLCLSLWLSLKGIHAFVFREWQHWSERVERYGRQSLDVYVFHYFVLFFIHISVAKCLPWMWQNVIAVMVALSVIEICLLASKPIEKNKTLRLLLLGKK